MGLTMRQAEEVLRPISQAYDKYAQTRIMKARTDQAVAAAKWERDVRVLAVKDTVENALGGINWDAGYRGPKQWFLERVIENWDQYESGFLKGPLYDALKDAGYVKLEDINDGSFYKRPEYMMLQVALRTTRKHWSDIAAPFSALIVGTTLATSEKEVLLACNDFLEALK